MWAPRRNVVFPSLSSSAARHVPKGRRAHVGPGLAPLANVAQPDSRGHPVPEDGQPPLQNRVGGTKRFHLSIGGSCLSSPESASAGKRVAPRQQLKSQSNWASVNCGASSKKTASQGGVRPFSAEAQGAVAGVAKQFPRTCVVGASVRRRVRTRSPNFAKGTCMLSHCPECLSEK